MKHYIMRPVIFGEGRSDTLRVLQASSDEEARAKADAEFDGDMHVIEAVCDKLVIHS